MKGWKQLNKNHTQLLSIYLLAQIFYLFTLAPTVLWGDQANFQRLAYTLNFEAEYTYAKHTLWVMLAHPFTNIPIHDIAFRVNLFTSIWGAIGVLFVFATLKNLTASFWASLIGALALMVSHNYWLNAVRTEVYSFNMALLAISLYYFTHPKANKIHYLLGGVAVGLAVSNHSMMWLVVPAMIILIVGTFLQSKITGQLGLIAFAGFIVSIILIRILLPVNDTSELIDLNPSNYIPNWNLLPGDMMRLAAFWILQFPSPALIIMIVGIRKSINNLPLSLGLAFIWVANIILLVNLNFADKYVFYMLSYFVGAIWVGLGVEPVVKWLKRVIPMSYQRTAILLAITIVALPLLAYTVAPNILPMFGVTSQRLGLREIPGRPALAFFLSPSARGYWGAYNFAEDALISLPPNATIIADYTVAQPLLYMKIVEKIRADVDVVDVPVHQQSTFVQNNYQTRPIYLALTEPYYDIDGISEHFIIVPEGLIYRLEAKNQN